jgi:uncharacterized membrane protein YqjE
MPALKWRRAPGGRHKGCVRGRSAVLPETRRGAAFRVVTSMVDRVSGPDAGHPAAPASTEPSVGELVTQLSEQTSRLVRSEMQLAQAEMQQKAKNAGVGVGLFGAAGIVGLYGAGALVATVILALSLVLPAWAAALIVTVTLFAIAGIVALTGKNRVSRATPPVPRQTIDSVKRDIETVKEGRHRGDAP